MSRIKPHSKTSAREKAFQTLYSFEFSHSTTLGALRAAWSAMPDPDTEEVTEKDTPAPKGYAWELVEGVWSHLAEIDILINRFSKHWRVDRLGRVEATILRIAIFEMQHRPDVPAKVALNEALDMTFAFGDEKAKNLVNGILNAVIKALESGELVRDKSLPASPDTTDKNLEE